MSLAWLCCIELASLTSVVGSKYTATDINDPAYNKRISDYVQSRLKETPGTLDAGKSLYDAIMSGDEKKALHYIDGGADIHFKQGRYGTKYILLACNRGLVEVVRVLIDMGEDPNFCRTDGYCCIHTASSNGHVEVVKRLLEKGAKKNVTSKAGDTPLVMAEKNGFSEVVAVLTAKDGRNLLNAVLRKSEEEALELISQGADINWQEPYHDGSPFLAACNRGLRDVVRIMLNKGVDINAQQSLGYTCLSTASGRGHVEIVKECLDSGADKDIKNSLGQTALRMAADGKHSDIVQMLESYESPSKQKKATSQEL